MTPTIDDLVFFLNSPNPYIGGVKPIELAYGPKQDLEKLVSLLHRFLDPAEVF